MTKVLFKKFKRFWSYCTKYCRWTVRQTVIYLICPLKVEGHMKIPTRKVKNMMKVSSSTTNLNILWKIKAYFRAKFWKNKNNFDQFKTLKKKKKSRAKMFTYFHKRPGFQESKGMSLFWWNFAKFTILC